MWGITEGQIGALGQIIQNIDSAEMQSRETGGGNIASTNDTLIAIP
jgi:hypothetical protein